MALPARIGWVHNGGLHPVTDGAELGRDGFLLEVGYRPPGLDTILNSEHLSFQLKAKSFGYSVLSLVLAGKRNPYPENPRTLRSIKLKLMLWAVYYPRYKVRWTDPMRRIHFGLTAVDPADNKSCRGRKEWKVAVIKAADKCSLTVYHGLTPFFTSLLSWSGTYTGWMPLTSVLKDVYGRQFFTTRVSPYVK